MEKTKISKDIRYIGVNDHEIDLFEGQYIVPNGMSYNSYVIVDEKTAVMDTVDINFTHEWLDNLQKVIGEGEYRCKIALVFFGKGSIDA